jgi:hypothetical protein
MNRLELLEGLKSVLPGVDQKGTVLLEGANTFIFDTDWIKSFNNNLSVSYAFSSGIKCSVKAEEFFKAINKMTGIEIFMKLEDEKLIVKNTKTKLAMQVSNDQIGEYIDNFKLENLDWKEIPKDFFAGIQQCLFSASSQSSSGVLNAIYINGKNIISSDNYRISWYFLEAEMEDLLLPLAAAKELCKINNLTQYCIGESWAHFANESIVISIRVMLGDYPMDSIKDFFEIDKSQKYIFPKEIGESLDRTEILSSIDPEGNYDDFVSIFTQDIKKEGTFLIIKGERTYGSIYDKIKIDPKTFPTDIILKISPKFLHNIIDHSCEFQLKEKNLILFSTNKFKHLISTAIK